jgi:hypothetical protein
MLTGLHIFVLPLHHTRRPTLVVGFEPTPFSYKEKFYMIAETIQSGLSTESYYIIGGLSTKMFAEKIQK